MLLNPLITSEEELTASLMTVNFFDPTIQVIPSTTRNKDTIRDDDATDTESVHSDASTDSNASITSLREFEEEAKQSEKKQVTYQSFREILENPPIPFQKPTDVYEHFWDHLKGDHAPRQPKPWKPPYDLGLQSWHYLQFRVYYEWFQATGLPLVEMRYTQILHEVYELQDEIYESSETFESYLEDKTKVEDISRVIWLMSVMIGFIKYTQSNLIDGLEGIIDVPWSMGDSEVKEYNEAVKTVDEEILEWKTASTERPMLGLRISPKEEIEQKFQKENKDNPSELHMFRYNLQWLKLMDFHSKFPSDNRPLLHQELVGLELLIRIVQDSSAPTQEGIIKEVQRIMNQSTKPLRPLSVDDIKGMFFRSVLLAPAINEICDHLRSVIEKKWGFIGGQVALGAIDPSHTKGLLDRFEHAPCVESLMKGTPHGAWDGLLKCMDASVFTYEQKEFNQLVLLPLSFTQTYPDFEFEALLDAKFTDLKEEALGAMQKSAGADAFPDFAFDIRIVDPNATALLGLFPAVRNDFVLVVDIVNNPEEGNTLVRENLNLLNKMKPDKDHKMIVLHLGLNINPDKSLSLIGNGDGRPISSLYKLDDHLVHKLNDYLVHIPYFFIPNTVWQWVINMAYFRRMTTFYSNYDKDYDSLLQKLKDHPSKPIDTKPIEYAISDHIMKPVLRFLGQLRSTGMQVDSKLDAALQTTHYAIVDPEIHDTRKSYSLPESDPRLAPSDRSER
jgi:hypothetical protein